MEPLRVHIAELVIADDPATADVATAEAVTERATAAGHAVVGRVVVRDHEAAIRAQLETWIADPEVDVVIATGPHESKAAGGALKPLVTVAVPGFTDLFRWLAFQDIGASAMQSTAEAARCGSTFVFVLPASPKGVRDTMDKIINPQLDPNTTPNNLVTEMPRLQPLVAAAEAVRMAALQLESVPVAIDGSKTEAVPQEIGPEKTEAGLGGAARLPARKSPTGQHVLRKDSPSDVTRQVDRAQLERDLKTSSEHDSPTKPNIDLRKLIPRVPPGADEVDVETLQVGDDTDLTEIPPPQPLARVKGGSPPTVDRSAQVATVRPRKPPTIQIPVLSSSAPKQPVVDEVTHEVPSLRSETIKTKAAPPAATRADTEPSRPAAMTIKPGAKAERAKAGMVRPTPPALTPPAGVSPLKSPAREAFAEVRPMEVVSLAQLAAEVEREISADEANGDALIVDEKPIDDAPPVPAATAIAPIPPKRRPPTEPPPPPPAVARTKRALTKPPPPPKPGDTEELADSDLVGASAIVAVATGDAATVRGRPRRTPTTPPPPRESNDDLPRGKFVYPVHRSPARKVMTWALLAAIAAAGGVAFVKVFLIDKPQRDVAVAGVSDAATPASDAAQVASAEPDAVIPEIVIDVSGGSGADLGSDAGSNQRGPDTGHAGHSGHGPDTGHTGHGPDTGHTGHTGHEGSAAAPQADAGATTLVADAATISAEPSVDKSCDEVSCVLEKYARPCCARYKPTDTGFKPTVPGELDKTMVRAGIDTVKPRVIACGEKLAAKGTVKVMVSVGPEGTVKEASVVEAPTPELGTCVAAALRSAQFGKSTKGGTFTYPFVF